jgi:hypothetical protein
MKRLMVLLMAVLLVLTSAAHAAVPSKTTQDMATVVSMVSASGVALGAEFVVALTEPTEAATQQLADIAAVVSAGGSPVSYFAGMAEGMLENIALLLPPDFDPDTLELNEFSPLTGINYDEAYGDVVVSFEFATAYADGQVLVAMVGIPIGENEDGTAIVEWYALQAEVVDGIVQVTFPQDVLVLLDGADAMIAILSEPVELIEPAE